MFLVAVLVYQLVNDAQASGYTERDDAPHVLTLFWKDSSGYCVKKVITGYNHKHSCESAGYVACDIGRYDEFECDKKGEEKRWDDTPRC